MDIINEYVSGFSSDIHVVSEDENSIHVDFDVGWAFASALSALGTIGGLGVFMVSAISEAIFWGSMLGIGSVSFGLFEGVLFAPLMGPVGLAFGLGLAACMGAIKLFGGGWEKSVANKFVKAFEEKKVQETKRSFLAWFPQRYLPMTYLACFRKRWFITTTSILIFSTSWMTMANWHSHVSL